MMAAEAISASAAKIQHDVERGSHSELGIYCRASDLYSDH
jgi:hypothetical protein